MQIRNTGTPGWRVAVVTETYPPEVNGVAMSIARIVDGLVERGHRVELVRPRQRSGEVGMLTSRFTEHLMPSWPLPRYQGLRIGQPCAGTLARMWRQRRPDVVHIATEGPLGWSAHRAARQLQIATTSDFRTNFHTYASHYGLQWLERPVLSWLRRFHNHTGATMVPTEAMRRELKAQGFERLHVVGRGVDTQLFQPSRRSAALRASWGAGESDIVLCCVGRLAAEKNLATVVKAFEAVRRQRADARLLLVGDGPMREELQGLCPDAIFAGHRSGEDLAAHYASADLFVFASQTETFGNVTTEALASGLPVVAFDLAAAGQLVTSGDNGVLVSGGDNDRFVQAVVALAGDAQARRCLAMAARQTACRLGWSGVVGQFERVLAQARDEHHAAHLPLDAAQASPLHFSDTVAQAMPVMTASSR